MLCLPEPHKSLETAIPSRNPTPNFSYGSYDVLNRLRLCAMGCRVAARTNLFEACALLTLEGEDAKRTFISTLIKCLSDAVHAPIKWYQPGASELTFDEAWVLRCLSSIEVGDTISLEFLLRSRVTPAARRYIGYLLGRISDQFAQI
jgi:hypothetical protein